jgi:hypothetical protein
MRGFGPLLRGIPNVRKVFLTQHVAEETLEGRLYKKTTKRWIRTRASGLASPVPILYA